MWLTAVTNELEVSCNSVTQVLHFQISHGSIRLSNHTCKAFDKSQPLTRTCLRLHAGFFSMQNQALCCFSCHRVWAAAVGTASPLLHVERSVCFRCRRACAEEDAKSSQRSRWRAEVDSWRSSGRWERLGGGPGPYPYVIFMVAGIQIW